MNESNFNTTALYRNGIMVLLLLSIALIVHNIFGQNGYLASRRQRKELQTLEQKVQQLKHENEQLDKTNHALKSDPAAIERQAREGMGLSKPGEKIYKFSDKPLVTPPPPAGHDASPNP